MRHVCEKRSRSGASLWAFFSRASPRLPTRNDGEHQKWLVSGLLSVCDCRWKTDGFEYADLDVDLGNKRVRRTTGPTAGDMGSICEVLAV
jgi:hypothetical protein